MATLTARRLRELLDYDPKTGVFRWKHRQDGLVQWNARFVGKVAGGIDPDTGYWQIRIDDKLYYAHRLAWLYVYGRWPRSLIDHSNRDQIDNRIIKLREATKSQNVMNGKLRIDNSSGHTGVYYSKRLGKWTAEIHAKKKRHRLGWFGSLDDAVAARRIAAKKYHGNFARPL